MASSRCEAWFFCEAPAFEVEYGLDGRVPREGEDVFLDDEEIDGLDGEGPYRFVAERVGWQFGKRGLEEAIVKLGDGVMAEGHRSHARVSHLVRAHAVVARVHGERASQEH